MKEKWYVLVIALMITVFVFAGNIALAVQKPKTVAELALYKGADRQQMLEEGAKKEGKINFYTTGVMAGSLGAFLDLYKKKYPYVKLGKWRAGSRELTSRILEEYQSGKHSADVVEATQVAHMTLKEQGILQPFYSPYFAHIDEGGITKAPGGSAFSAAFRFNPISLAYNTNLLSKEEAPKTYQDLLDPKWKGKLVLPGGNVPVSWVGTILKTYGIEFVKKVAQQNFIMHTMSARALLDLIIAGEYVCSPSIFESHVIKSRKMGAPVDWVPLEPVHVNISLVALPKYSSHPHAAMLLIDLKFSKEVAEIQKANGYIPTRTDFPVERTYKKFFGAESMVEGLRWQKMYNSLFLRR
ncbi:ABC transporter substrate-binding protein [Thermodesulfobacteriota bacterium]